MMHRSKKNWSQIKSYLQLTSKRGIKPGLGRMKALMKILGNPEKKFKAIHVTGTNGKGSVCAMLESILRCQGYKTGFYSSPHILDITERITVFGKNISPDSLYTWIGEIKKKAGKIEPELTYFE